MQMKNHHPIVLLLLSSTPHLYDRFCYCAESPAPVMRLIISKPESHPSQFQLQLLKIFGGGNTSEQMRLKRPRVSRCENQKSFWQRNRYDICTECSPFNCYSINYAHLGGMWKYCISLLGKKYALIAFARSDLDMSNAKKAPITQRNAFSTLFEWD